MRKIVYWLAAWYERRDFDKEMKEGEPVDLVGTPRVVVTPFAVTPSWNTQGTNTTVNWVWTPPT